MGYDTNHILNHSLTEDEEKIFIEKYKEHFGEKGGLCEDEVEELLAGEYVYAKWYENREEMKFMSKFFPEDEFMLEGIGEESDDFWKEYYKNGKHQFCKGHIVFDEPTEEGWCE